MVAPPFYNVDYRQNTNSYHLCYSVEGVVQSGSNQDIAEIELGFKFCDSLVYTRNKKTFSKRNFEYED